MSLDPRFVEQDCLKRIRHWRVPPNWVASDWLAEACAQAQIAAWEAVAVYDASKGVSQETFVKSRVLARVLTRYRKEWAYAGRCAALPLGNSSRREPPVYEDLRGTFSRLRDRDRRLLEQLFWEGRSQAEIREELGVSQRAVSKRKQVILRGLRGLLGCA